ARRHLQSLHIFLLSSTTTTDIYTLSLHDALPISSAEVASDHRSGTCGTEGSWYATRYRHSRTPLDTKSRSRCAISPRHYPIRLLPNRPRESPTNQGAVDPRPDL